MFSPQRSSPHSPLDGFRELADQGSRRSRPLFFACGGLDGRTGFMRGLCFAARESVRLPYGRVLEFALDKGMEFSGFILLASFL